MDTVSVIVPVYNCAAQVGRCVESLLAQTLRVQIVAVDDGSTDGSLPVLEALAQAHPHRLLVLHQENRGVTAARLAGLAAASGDWIGFVDGDDAVEPEMYAFLLRLAQSAQAQIAHCGHQVRYPDGRVGYVHNSGTRWIRDRRTALQDLLDGGQIDSSLCTKLFHRTLFSGLADWMCLSLKNGEDLMMNYHLFAQADRSVYEDVCPYHYILREGSASHHQFNEHVLFDPVRSRAHILAHCPPELEPDARRSLLRNLLFAYAQASLRPRRISQAYRDQARSLLQAQQAHFSLLSRRNRLLAAMICRAPWTFDLAYGAYMRLFHRQEEH